jgi:hypothetical protein
VQPFYIRLKGKVWGPFSMDQLKTMQVQGRLSSFHELSQDRRTWVPVFETPELGTKRPAASSAPRAVPVASAVAASPSAEPPPLADVEDEEPTDFSPGQQSSRDFDAWESRLGWQRVRTGLILLAISGSITICDFVLLTSGALSAILGDSPAGLFFVLMLFQIGRAITVLVELAGATFCAAAPSASGIRALGIAALVLLLLEVVLSVFPTVYSIQLGAAHQAPFGLREREAAGVLIALVLFAALSALAWIGWNVMHLCYLIGLMRFLKPRDAGALPHIAIFLFFAGVALGFVVVGLASIGSSGVAVDRFGNRRPDDSAAAAVVLLTGVATAGICLAYFGVYLTVLVKSIKEVGLWLGRR